MFAGLWCITNPQPVTCSKPKAMFRLPEAPTGRNICLLACSEEFFIRRSGAKTNSRAGGNLKNITHQSQHSMEEKDEKLWRIAKKRAEFKKHLYTYIIINAFLWAI